MSRRPAMRPPLPDAAYTRPGPAGPGVGWLRRLGPFIRRYRGAVVATLILSVVAQTLIGLLPLIQQMIVDHSILTKQHPVGPMLVVLLSTGMLGFTANYGRRYLGARSASASSTICDWRSIGISTSSTFRGTTNCRSAT